MSYFDHDNKQNQNRNQNDYKEATQNPGYQTIEYKLVPTQSFTIIRGCSGCGRKTSYKNTDKFRVNANGSRIDVWLIYQCENCRHTYNLPIYERRKNTDIPVGEYQRFLDNDAQLSEEYGRNLPLFQKHKAKIDHQSINYELLRLQDTIDATGFKGQVQITIQNPYCLKIRPEKLAAEILGQSASSVKKQVANGFIRIESTANSAINVYLENNLKKENQQ